MTRTSRSKRKKKVGVDPVENKEIKRDRWMRKHDQRCTSDEDIVGGCNLGCRSTLTQESTRWKKDTKSCRRTSDGIVCTRCNTFSCRRCLRSIFRLIDEKTAQSTDLPDGIEQMKKALKDNQTVVSTCHGCIFDSQKEHVMRSHDHFIHVESQEVELRYDGYIVLPEYNLIIDTPLNSENVIDCHGFGKEPNLAGVKHFVVGYDLARQAAALDVKPSKLTETVETSLVYVTCPEIANPNKKRLYRVQLIVVHGTQCTQKINNYPEYRVESLDKSMVFSVADRGEDCDATIIVGSFSESPELGQKQNLLLARFYHESCVLRMNQNRVHSLFREVRNMTRNNHIERKRTGGSSGVYKGPTRALFQMLEYPSVTPRKGNATFVVPDQHKIHVFYINRKGKPTHWAYSNPQYGGQIGPVTRELFSEYNVFKPFTESKIVSALLLTELSKIGNKLNVVPLAVERELRNYKKAMTRAGSNDIGEILYQFCSLNSTTLVQHPVGVHYDKFGTDEEGVVFSLENKIGFATKNPEFYRRYGMGRGGRGPKTFVFCLLDWGKERKQRTIARRNLEAAEEVLTQRQAEWQAALENWMAVAENQNATQDEEHEAHARELETEAARDEARGARDAANVALDEANAAVEAAEAGANDPPGNADGDDEEDDADGDDEEDDADGDDEEDDNSGSGSEVSYVHPNLIDYGSASLPSESETEAEDVSEFWRND